MSKQDLIQLDFSDQAYRQNLFTGCDPGLSAPCVAVLTEDGALMATFFIDGSTYKGDTYARAWQVGAHMAEWYDINYGSWPTYLVIEGSPFMKNSRSIESMAQCRQAIYDAFTVLLNAQLKGCYKPKPSQVKQIAKARGASKEDIFETINVLYPRAFSRLGATHRIITKGKKKGQQELTKEAEAIADAIAITLAGIRMWE
jgi:hypothetical protein